MTRAASLISFIRFDKPQQQTPGLPILRLAHCDGQVMLAFYEVKDMTALRFQIPTNRAKLPAAGMAKRAWRRTPLGRLVH